MTEHIELDRKFWPVEADKENDPESIRVMYAYDSEKQLSWDNLLEKARVIIIAEPGTGKTEEFKAVTKRLRIDGKSAFFFRIELLQTQELEVRHSLDIGNAEEFDKWLAEEKEAYFFLDSVDEARLTSHTAFDITLRRFSNRIGESLNRAKIFVSCRVSNWRATADLSLFSKHLPKPKALSVQDNQTTSTEDIKQADKKTIPTIRSIEPEEKEDHIVFQLAPLNDHQIRLFAAKKNIEDTKDFTDAIEKADASIFAERPQDLLDLIEYWRSNGRLGRHATMLDFNIHKKLQEHNPNRDDLRPLSSEDALSAN